MTAPDRPRIAAVGAYAPRLRVPAEEYADAWGRFEGSGIEATAVPNADEDALTMGWEAATRALDAAGQGANEVGFLAFASTTPPLAEEDLTVRLGSTLGVPENATRHVFTGSTRASTRALSAALAAGPWGEHVGVVVASNAPRGEPGDERDHAAGAGAAAFVLDADGSGEIVATGEYATPYPGERFRTTGSERTDGLAVTPYDRTAFRETLAGAVADLESRPETVDAAAVQAPDGALPYRVAESLGVETEAIHTCATVHDLGDTGAASVPLSISRALSDGHERILVAAYGSGAGADAMVIDAGSVPVNLDLDGDRELSYAEYLRRRGEITPGAPEGGGAYVSVPSWRRSLPHRHRLVAGRCPDCEALAFPPDGACPGCGALVEYGKCQLPGTGTVEAVTTISAGGAPPEFAEQQAQSGEFGVAIVAFDGPDGGPVTDPADDTVSIPAQVTDGGSENVGVGDRVEATIRRIYTQEGVTRYGVKVKPSDDG